ncbi:MAG: DUF945 domain-containing protein [bacterium]|nr:DUF945 domain-containing protein [bacterium]
MYLSNLTPLKGTELRTLAPSIFTEECAPWMSDKYSFIPTYDVGRKLTDMGWKAFLAKEDRTAAPAQRGFQRHLVSFYNPYHYSGEEEVPVISLENSHNGKCSFRFHCGFFVRICANGLHVSADMVKYRIIHYEDLTENLNQVMDDCLSLIEDKQQRIQDFKQITLDDTRQLKFAKEAAAIRWSDTQPIMSEQLLTRLRSAYEDNSLWSVYNTVQENLVRGGLEGKCRTGRNHTTRKIKSIDGDLRINKALWKMTEDFTDITEMDCLFQNKEVKSEYSDSLRS